MGVSLTVIIGDPLLIGTVTRMMVAMVKYHLVHGMWKSLDGVLDRLVEMVSRSVEVCVSEDSGRGRSEGVVVCAGGGSAVLIQV